METIIKQIKMSSTDLTPSRIGFGAMGLTAFYSSTNPVSEVRKSEISIDSLMLHQLYF